MGTAFEVGGFRGLWPSALAIAAALCEVPNKPSGLPDLLRLLTAYAHEVPEPGVPDALRRFAQGPGSSRSHVESRVLVAAFGADVNGYVTESRLAGEADARHLDLATALGMTPKGPVANPVLFTGFLARPDVASSGLLAVADVAASRYADVGLAARVANLDPVVTAGGDRLRFESFSACNGVYARFDLLREGVGTGDVGFGTTNVDINLPLRTALARVDRAEPST